MIPGYGAPEYDGADLLDRLHDVLTMYVILPSPEAADAVVAWIAATHAQPAWEAATRLVVKSPEKRCGKSRLIDIIEATCHAPLLTVNISPAALVRSIGDNPPTLLLDEADTVFGKKAADNHEDLRGIVNAGHQRNRPYVRWDATARAPEHCPTFAMAALAGIGDMPDTIEDRAVIISMRRRAPGERVHPFRRRDVSDLHDLRDDLAGWLESISDLLAKAEPEMPVEDRAADNWEPLFAVADAAGGSWPVRIHSACLALTGESDQDSATSLGVKLLADVRGVFGDAEAMSSRSIISRLVELEESPWSDFFGRMVSQRDVAKLLKPYGVRSCDVKIDGSALKGYRRDVLYQAWQRYLPDAGTLSATSATTATTQVSDHDQVAGRGQETRPATDDPPVTSTVAQVAQVADTPPACVRCGSPLLIASPGRDRCEACRLAVERGEP